MTDGNFSLHCPPPAHEMAAAPGQPVRVLHVLDHLKLGGVQTFAMAMARWFDDPRFSLSWLALHGRHADPRFGALEPAPGVVSQRRCDPMLLFRLRRAIRSAGCAIVHAHGVPSCLLCGRFRRYLGIGRLIVHIHHVYGEQRTQRVQNALERAAYRNADVLLGCSQHVLDSVPVTIPKELLFHGVDTTAFQPVDSETAAAARREWGFTPADVVAGFVGRLGRDKDPGVLLRALGLLRERLPELRALIVGSGPDETVLRALAGELGVARRVVFTGYRTDVARCLAAMDVFVMPSYDEEGFGLALIEAMAAGLPCIVSDYPSAREIVTDGLDAMGFPQGDAAALAEHVRQLSVSGDTRVRLGAAARQTVCRRFDIRHSAQCLVDIYTRLIH